MEVEDADDDGMIDRGFRTFMVYNEADKEFNIASPHPAYDLNTGYESIRIFKYTSSPSFSMAGTHRYVSSTTSPCQSSYKISDVAHNDDCLFFAPPRSWWTITAALYGAKSNIKGWALTPVEIPMSLYPTESTSLHRPRETSFTPFKTTCWHIIPPGTWR